MESKTYKGFVKWFSAEKGYGFIRRDGKEGDVFVHYTGIMKESGEKKNLNKGDIVYFNIEEIDDRGPKAINVVSGK